MKMLKLILIVVAAGWLAGCGSPYATVPNRQGAEVMLLGYDPTAYFTQGKPVRGSPENRVDMGTRTYYFESSQSKALFTSAPSKFEPQYGGFCSSGAAYALKLGSDPTAWQIYEGRLFIFGDVLGKIAWQLDPKWNVEHADRLWPEMRDRGWRAQSLMRFANKVPHYKTGAQITQEWKQKDPNMVWPAYDTGGMLANLFTKPPGWRAAEGFSQPALGYLP